MYLNDFLSEHCKDDNVASIIKNLSNAAIIISNQIKNVDKKVNSEVNLGNKNADGDLQKPLDIFADDILINCLKGCPVSGYASEEQDGFIDFKNDHNLIVLADPLDGSSNIDVNVTIGTIFSIISRNNLPLKEAFLQKGIHQNSSGFFVYGPQTTLFLTVGKGTYLFALNESSQKFLLINKIDIPQKTSEFAINASYKRFWDQATLKYVNNCQLGEDGVRKKNFGMRWVGSLVADASRIFIRGGIFLYPADNREKYREGRLRLTYEANPIAYLVEQANGMATNGTEKILNLDVQKIHQRTALIFGSKEEVVEFKNSFDNP
jgi:fructose-1,6-bisphosphatase I